MKQFATYGFFFNFAKIIEALCGIEWKYVISRTAYIQYRFVDTTDIS